jgi:predicted P-loop ATPase
MAKVTQCLTNQMLEGSAEFNGVIGYNVLYHRIETIKPTPWGFTGPWNEVQDTKLHVWLEAHGCLCSREQACHAIQHEAIKNEFNPLQDWLKGLKWDNMNRVDSWLTDFAGVESSEYTRAIGKRWLVSGVARALNPGCKVDTCVIFEGNQGIGKSRMLRALAEPYFTDDIADFGSKDAALQMQRAWIIELAELDTMGKAEASQIKAFMSRSVDQFRPPYGRHVIESPRHCIFAGTVNGGEFLRDETGARRFWPVHCEGFIDVEGIKRNREQMWAEAVALYRQGATWWLDDSTLVAASEEQQAAYQERDVWLPLIETYMRHSQTPETIGNILELCLNKLPGTWTHYDKVRVGKCLRNLGAIQTQRHGSSIKYYHLERDRVSA